MPKRLEWLLCNGFDRVEEEALNGWFRLLPPHATNKVQKVNCTICDSQFHQFQFRQFHPIAYMLISNETAADFEHFFRSLQAALAIVLPDVVFDMKYCFTDAALAMRNGIHRIWPLCIVLMCWFHVMQAVSLLLMFVSCVNATNCLKPCNGARQCKTKFIVTNINQWLCSFLHHFFFLSS